MALLTIYTPAYNRGNLLKNVYNSLICQSCRDFLWMIIDDGSTDDTENIVSDFISEGKIPIKYIKKENGGKHTATNLALSEADTELIMLALDSDDTLKPDAVETILKKYREADGKYSGYVFMKEDTSGKLMISHMNPELKIKSWREATAEGDFDGEALLVLKTEYAKKFSYPVIPGEKFFTEAYVYLRMTEPFLWCRESVYVAEYLGDGYTKNIINSFVKNPVSYSMYNDLRLGIYSSFPKRFKYAAYYVAFSLLGGKKKILRSSSAPLLCFAAFPFGAAFSVALKIAWHFKQRKTKQN